MSVPLATVAAFDATAPRLIGAQMRMLCSDGGSGGGAASDEAMKVHIASAEEPAGSCSATSRRGHGSPAIPLGGVEPIAGQSSFLILK